MVRVVTTDRELEIANKIGKKLSDRGLKVDDIKYSGNRGSFTLTFKKGRFSPLLLEDHSGIDWDEVARLVCGDINWYL